MTFAAVQVKWSVILIDRLGPDIFSTLRMKGHVLHRARAHLKVPGWSLVWNTLLTKKLPMFLSRLNEIYGGCEKILPVSGSFWSNLKFFRMIDFTAWLWGWNVRVKREGETWGWNVRVKREGETWGWNVRVKREGETWGWMEFYRCCLFVTFVVLTVDQFVGQAYFHYGYYISLHRHPQTFNVSEVFFSLSFYFRRLSSVVVLCCVKTVSLRLV